MKYSKEYRRILLTGATGQVGWELSRTLAPFGEVIAPGRDKFDLARPESLREKIREWKPDLIVNPAAYTAVDQAELEHELAFTINSEAPRVLAEESESLKIPIVHYSTDYVFDGKKETPYTEDDSVNPINVYGESKFKGEQEIQKISEQHIILRTSWVYSQQGSNFLTTMLKLFREKSELYIVGDQIGAPTSAQMLAEATAIIVGKKNDYGLYHLTASGKTSWFGFSKAILEYADIDHDVILNNIYTSEYQGVAKRPLNSVLNCEKIQFNLSIKAHDWVHYLKQMEI